MPASLKFESAVGAATADLSQVKIVTLQDNTGNKYTLDVTGNDLKLIYHKQGSPQPTEYTVDGLATALGSLLSTKDNDKSVLVDTLGEFLDSQDQAMYDGQNNQTAQVFLGGKGLKGEKGETGEDGKSPSAAEIAAIPALQTAVAADPNLHTAVAGDAGLRTAVAGNADLRTAVATNADLHTAVAAVPDLKAHVAKINIKSPEFRSAVQDEISQPVFDIPADDSAPISVDW